MSGIPRKTWVYTVILAGVTVLAVGASLWQEGWSWTPEALGTAVILFAMILLAEHLDVHFPHQATFTVSVGGVLALASGITLGPLHGTLVVMVGNLVTDVLGGRKPIQTTVNVANIGFSTLVGTSLYEALAVESGTPLHNIQNAAGILVAALAYALVNSWILAAVVAPVHGATSWEVWLKNKDGFLIELVMLVTLGSLIPVVASANPLGIFLFIIPLAGPHLAIRALRAVEEETRATMESLADALERRDPYTFQHSSRVADYAREILVEMPHLALEASEAIVAAARVHDLGKVGTRDVALKKPAALDPGERLELQQHAVIGADIVSHLSMYEASAAIIRHHHEWWNGEGYPDGLREEAIPLGARIIAVADAYDAMTSDRVYRKALTSSTALAELRKQAGRQFDPQVVAAFERSQARRVAVPERRLAAAGSG